MRRIGIDKPLFRPGPAVNDSWPPDRIFNGLVMMRRLGQRVVRAQGLDQPGMNDLGILAELRLEDGMPMKPPRSGSRRRPAIPPISPSG